jgi:hypothetical protein
MLKEPGIVNLATDGAIQNTRINTKEVYPT